MPTDSGFQTEADGGRAVHDVGRRLGSKAPDDSVVQLGPVDGHVALIVFAKAAAANVFAAAIAIADYVFFAVVGIAAGAHPRSRRHDGAGGTLGVAAAAAAAQVA